MIVSFTGHRPDKLGKFDASNLRVALDRTLLELHPERTISGMAPGFDVIALEQSRSLGIPVTAAIPWETHGLSWGWWELGLDQYLKYLDMCDKHVVVSQGEYKPWFFQKRNEWMVDNSELVIAAWDGSNGGTANCVKYAQKIGRRILFYDWNTMRFVERE